MRKVILILSFLLVFLCSTAKQAFADCTLRSDSRPRAIGTIIYNKSWDVLQLCSQNGRWLALSPVDYSSSCLLDGRRVPSGGSHKFYDIRTHVDCASRGQIRQCVDTVLNGDPAYAYADCTPVIPDPCETGPVGTLCNDDAVYVGNSVDGIRLYISSEDDSEAISWNDGSANWVDTPITDCTGALDDENSCYSGFENTALLYELGDGPSPAPYKAARLCKEKGDNWYLPSFAEMGPILSYLQQ